MLPFRQQCLPELGSQGAVQPIVQGVLDLYEWHLLVTTHVNVLLEGPAPYTEAVLGMCTPFLISPIGVWAGEPPEFRLETLVVREVGTLTLDGQRLLLDWIESAGQDVRVLATSAQLLFTLVQHGAFLSELYYRLNVLRLDLSQLEP